MATQPNAFAAVRHQMMMYRLFAQWLPPTVIQVRGGIQRPDTVSMMHQAAALKAGGRTVRVGVPSARRVARSIRAARLGSMPHRRASAHRDIGTTTYLHLRPASLVVPPIPLVRLVLWWARLVFVLRVSGTIRPPALHAFPVEQLTRRVLLERLMQQHVFVVRGFGGIRSQVQLAFHVGQVVLHRAQLDLLRPQRVCVRLVSGET